MNKKKVFEKPISQLTVSDLIHIIFIIGIAVLVGFITWFGANILVAVIGILKALPILVGWVILIIVLSCFSKRIKIVD